MSTAMMLHDYDDAAWRKYLEARFSGFYGEEYKQYVRGMLNQLRGLPNGGREFSLESVKGCFDVCVAEKIHIDGEWYKLMPSHQNRAKLTIYEDYKRMLSKITEKLGVIIYCDVFSRDAVAYLQSKQLAVPDSINDIPLHINSCVGSLKDIGIISIKAVHIDTGRIVCKDYYTLDKVLDIAQISLDRTTGQASKRRGGTSGVWAGTTRKSDGVEMAKKTVEKQFVKTFSHLTGV